LDRLPIGAGLKRRLRPATALLWERRLRLSRRQLGLALVYHGVGGGGAEDPDALELTLGAESFAEQVDYLVRHYRTVRASELGEAATSRRRGERLPVAITFDDDRRSHLYAAKPILDRAGATATFFLSGASLEAPFGFWWERFERAIAAGKIGAEELRGIVPAREGVGSGSRDLKQIAADVEFIPPADRDALAAMLAERIGPDPADSGLRADEVRALAASGFEIGFHTLGHYNLAILDQPTLARELTAGRDELAAVTGKPITSVAYPGGRWTPEVLAAAREAGYEYGFTCDPIPLQRGDDRLRVGRLDPNWCGTIGHFAVAVSRAMRAVYPPQPPLPEGVRASSGAAAER
jgi:peptidoglycan/xylan/chitin deacetylase (PgdA/CDA1 family)